MGNLWEIENAMAILNFKRFFENKNVLTGGIALDVSSHYSLPLLGAAWICIVCFLDVSQIRQTSFEVTGDGLLGKRHGANSFLL